VPFTLSQRLQIRSLYLGAQKAPRQIAAEMGLKTALVQNVISKAGWAKERAETVKKTLEKQDARAARNVDAIVEHVAKKTEELSVRTLDFCEEALTARDAKTLQAASNAARNFVTLFRQARELDRPGLPGEGTVPLNVFVLRADSLKPEPKQAEQAHEIATGNAP